MQRSTSEILTTHTGSLPRSAELKRLLQARRDGQPIDEAQLQAAVAEAVKRVVKQQDEVGLKIVNDGEQSKNHFAGYLKDRLRGFDIPERPPIAHTFAAEVEEFPEYYARETSEANEALRRAARQACCVGPIEWKNFAEVERDIANLKAAVSGLQPADVFMTSPSPTFAALFQPNLYYPSEEAYLYAVADAIKREYKAIVDAGFILQVDHNQLFGANRRREEVSVEGQRRIMARNLEVLNYALADIPASAVRMHVCWGSDPGPHIGDGELKHFLDLLLTAKPQGLTLVCASPRHQHEWALWKEVKLPEDKLVVVGVIDHTSNIVEHPETVAERIVRYASVLGRENVIAGVDCGFAPAAGLDEYRVDPRIMWAKLGSLVEGARLASRHLWAQA